MGGYIYFKSYCFQYAIFLLVIIIIQVALAILLFVYGETIKEGIMSGIGGLYDKRSSPSVDKATIAVYENIETQVINSF